MLDTLAPPEAPAKLPEPGRAIARQAIVDASRSVAGYELFDRSLLTQPHTASSDAQLLFNVLSLAENDSLAASKTLFVNCTHDTLAGGHLDLVSPQRLVLEVPPLPRTQTDQIGNRLPALEAIHRRGFRMAFDYTVLTKDYERWLPLASYIKLDLSVLAPMVLGRLVKFAKSNSDAKLVAEKVESHAQFEMAAGLGIGLYQGYWFAKPVLVSGQTIRPAQANILLLINLVRQQASTSDIEAVLKHDPSLSYNLLRFINSAGFGLQTQITSFKHAVMLLGLNRLFKWAVLLMTTSQRVDAPSAIGSTAVVRGRLMELLATELLPPQECDNAFVVGVFSLLNAMLGMPLEAALANVALPTQVSDALLHRTGVLAPYLELTEACETGDDVAFARAATTLGLTSQQINWAHLQALSWAETIGN
jgi:c-di-GMP-related signal transduction protein